MYGVPDRGGGRENKGGSLRRSKKNPGAPAARVASVATSNATNKDANSNSPFSAPAPVVAQLKEILLAAQRAPLQVGDRNPQSLPTAATTTTTANISLDDANSNCCTTTTESVLMNIDTNVAILSRRYDGQIPEILQRSKDTGQCAAMITWCPEVDRQEELLTFCETHSDHASVKVQPTPPLQPSIPPSTAASCPTAVAEDDLCSEQQSLQQQQQLYCAIGIHPDNVDKTNKKLHAKWLEQVQSLAKSPLCVAVMTGLNLCRDASTHYPQESLMRSLCIMAKQLKLPVVVHLCSSPSSSSATVACLSNTIVDAQDEDSNPAAADAAMPSTEQTTATAAGTAATTVHTAIRILNEVGMDPSTVLIQNVLQLFLPLTLPTSTASTAAVSQPQQQQFASAMKLLSECGYYMSISARGLPSPASSCWLSALLYEVFFDHNHLLIGSNSPWDTPQNIPDEYLRCNANVPNEPSNLEPLVELVAAELLRSVAAGLDSSDSGSGSGVKNNKPSDDPRLLLSKLTTTIKAHTAALAVKFFQLDGATTTTAVVDATSSAVGVGGKPNTNTNTSSGNETNKHTDPTVIQEQNKKKKSTQTGTNPNNQKDGGDSDSSSGDDGGRVVYECVPLYPTTGGDTTTGNTPSAATMYEYTCVKCRSFLFHSTHLVTHPYNSKLVEFKSNNKQQRGTAGGGGSGGTSSGHTASCETALFLLADDVDHGDENGSCKKKKGIVVCAAEQQAVCSGCRGKLGSVGHNVPCPCGRLVPGATVRILASRVDKTIPSNTNTALEVGATTAAAVVKKKEEQQGEAEDLAALLKRAELELQQIALEDKRREEAEAEEKAAGAANKVKQAKVNVKASNRSNMGDYRNKNFTLKEAAKDEIVVATGINPSVTVHPAKLEKKEQNKPTTVVGSKKTGNSGGGGHRKGDDNDDDDDDGNVAPVAACKKGAAIKKKRKKGQRGHQASDDEDSSD